MKDREKRLHAARTSVVSSAGFVVLGILIASILAIAALFAGFRSYFVHGSKIVQEGT